MFKVGDLAVYPAHGVGRIEAIESKEISGLAQSFYIMRILENDMIIMIPTNTSTTLVCVRLSTPDKCLKFLRY